MDEPSNSVIIERLESLAEKNEEQHLYLRESIDSVLSGIAEHEKRIRILEDWKLVFVTKFSVYTAIALLIGSFLAQFIFGWIDKLLK